VPPKLLRNEENIPLEPLKETKKSGPRTAEQKESMPPELYKTREVPPQLPRNKEKWLYSRKK
jgi:hypothetical protein